MLPTFEGEVNVGAVELFVRQYGNAERDLVVLHGGPDWDHTYLLDALRPLSAYTRLTFYDHRGCGRSTRLGTVEGYTLDEAVDDLAALLERLNLQRPTLLGFSWGGRVALRFVSRFPDLADALILASSTAYTDFQAALEAKPGYAARKAAAQQTFQDSLRGDETPAEITRALAYAQLPLGVRAPDRLAQARRTLAGVQWSGEWWRALQAGKLTGVNHPDYAAVLRSRALPTLILHGRHDLSFPVEVARELHREVPHSRLVVLGGAHFCFVDEPEAWRRAVADFLTATA